MFSEQSPNGGSIVPETEHFIDFTTAAATAAATDTAAAAAAAREVADTAAAARAVADTADPCHLNLVVVTMLVLPITPLVMATVGPCPSVLCLNSILYSVTWLKPTGCLKVGVRGGASVDQPALPSTPPDAAAGAPCHMDSWSPGLLVAPAAVREGKT